jgi:hypothetical protein
MKFRLLGYGAMWAALSGTAEALTGSSVHEAIRYGLVIFTGIIIGLVLADHDA